VSYESQKRYFKTDNGKAALRRAQKKYMQKKKMEALKKIDSDPKCSCCGEKIFEFLNVYDDLILCYNCAKFGLDCPHLVQGSVEEIENAVFQ
jgi:formylmethanofuran dehydrogenase subunit E